MQEILRQASRLILLAAVTASTALAQSPPPTQDASKVQPPSEQTQKSQDQPVQQQGRQGVEQICRSGPWARAVVELYDGATLGNTAVS
jgi:guanyl-specific ribonuclease Sa